MTDEFSGGIRVALFAARECTIGLGSARNVPKCAAKPRVRTSASLSLFVVRFSVHPPSSLFNGSSIWLIAEPESTVISAFSAPVARTAVVNVNHAGTRGVINGTESRSRGESLARVIGAFSSLDRVLLDILTSSRELAVCRARVYVAASRVLRGGPNWTRRMLHRRQPRLIARRIDQRTRARTFSFRFRTRRDFSRDLPLRKMYK